MRDKMSKTSETIVRWPRRNVVLLALIGSVFAIGVWLCSEWIDLEQRIKGIERNEELAQSIQLELSALNKQIEANAPANREAHEKLVSLIDQIPAARHEANMAGRQWEQVKEKLHIWSWVHTLPHENSVRKSSDQTYADYKKAEKHADELSQELQRLQQELENSPYLTIYLEKYKMEQRVKRLKRIIEAEEPSINKHPLQNIILGLRRRLPLSIRA